MLVMNPSIDSPKTNTNTPMEMYRAPLPTNDANMKVRLSRSRAPAEMAKTLYGMGVKAAISVAHMPYLLNMRSTWSIRFRANSL